MKITKVNITTLIMIVSVIYMNKFKESKKYSNQLENKWNKIKLKF
jgi:hypothetical protein